MENNLENKIGYCLIWGGNNELFKLSFEPYERNLDPLLESGIFYYDKAFSEKSFFENTGPMASFGFKEFIFGITLFITTPVIHHEITELYKDSIRPSIISYYSEIYDSSNKDFIFEYRDLKFHEKFDTVILIRIRTKTPQELDARFDLLLEVQEKAYKWLEKNGKKAPIHDYLIDENSNVNIEPNLFNNLKEITISSQRKRLKIIGQE